MRFHRLLPALLCIFSLAFASGQENPLDRQALEEVEELSESLANALLDLSLALRAQDLTRAAQFFQKRVSMVSFPEALPSGRIRWIDTASQDLSGTLRKVTRAAVIQEWDELLGRFADIDDVRLKVSGAEFRRAGDRVTGSSALKFFLVGRDRSGSRRWLRSTGRLEAESPDGSAWTISLLELEGLDDWAAGRDLFSEVSRPAGVAVSLPAYGSPGNDDFVYHGAAAGDVNQDGLVDLVVTGLQGTHLYLNQGDGRFRDGAGEALIPPTPHSTSPLLLDSDNDGDLDIFLAGVGQQMLLESRLVPDGKLEFLDSSLESGVALSAIGFGTTAGDVNGDGWPDIYVSCYNLYGRIMPNSWHQATNGTANLLFVNQGDGTFKERASEWGVRDTRWSYAAQFADVNADGRQDLYVANDFGENALFINQGKRFTDQAKSHGTLDPGNGMGASFGDFNNDGNLDLYVTNMSSTAGNRILNRLFSDSSPGENVLRKLAAGNTLFQGSGDGRFRDVSRDLGPFSAGWAWGGVFVDFDNDGWQDIYTPNGFISGESMKDT